MPQTPRGIRIPESPLNYVMLVLLAVMLSATEIAMAQTPEVPADAPVPSQVEPAPPVEPVPVAPEPVVVEPVPVEPAPVVVEPAPAAPEPVPVEPAPVEPVPADDVVDEGAGEVVEPPAVPVDTGVPAEPAAPGEDVNTDETEEDPAETSGNDPGGEMPATPEPSPTVAPSPTPSPTPTPTSIAWSQPNPISCELLDGNAQSLALGDTATWRCITTIQAEVTGEPPADLSIFWTINASYAGDDVRFALPEGSLASLHQPDAVPGGTTEQVIYRSTWADGQSLMVDVTVTRTSCEVGDAQLHLNADIALQTADTTAMITHSNVKPVDTLLASTAAPNGEPVASFDGPISFEARSATSAGLDSNISRGTAVIVVEGEWNPCSTWTLDLGGMVDISASTPAQLRVVSINNETIPGGACDLSAGCVVTTLPESGSAATPLRLTLGLELELHQFTPVGSVGITVQVGANRVEPTQ